MYKNVRKPLFLLENVLDLLKKTKNVYCITKLTDVNYQSLMQVLHEFKLLFIWNMGYKRHVRFTLLQNTF